MTILYYNCNIVSTSSHANRYRISILLSKSLLLTPIYNDNFNRSPILSPVYKIYGGGVTERNVKDRIILGNFVPSNVSVVMLKFQENKASGVVRGDSILSNVTLLKCRSCRRGKYSGNVPYRDFVLSKLQRLVGWRDGTWKFKKKKGRRKESQVEEAIIGVALFFSN